VTTASSPKGSVQIGHSSSSIVASSPSAFSFSMRVFACSSKRFLTSSTNSFDTEKVQEHSDPEKAIHTLASRFIENCSVLRRATIEDFKSFCVLHDETRVDGYLSQTKEEHEHMHIVFQNCTSLFGNVFISYTPSGERGHGPASND